MTKEPQRKYRRRGSVPMYGILEEEMTATAAMTGLRRDPNMLEVARAYVNIESRQ